MVIINEIIEDTVKKWKSKTMGCKDCNNYEIEFDEYYDNSYCKKDICEFEWDDTELRRRIKDELSDSQEFKKLLCEHIRSLVDEENKKYLPCVSLWL